MFQFQNQQSMQYVTRMRCGGVLTFAGFGLIFMGCFVTGFAYKPKYPPFDDPFFDRGPEPGRIIGPVLLVLGFTILIFGIILYIRTKMMLQQALVQQQPQLVNTQPPIVSGVTPFQLYPPPPGTNVFDGRPNQHFSETGRVNPPNEPVNQSFPNYAPPPYSAYAGENQYFNGPPAPSAPEFYSTK